MSGGAPLPTDEALAAALGEEIGRAVGRPFDAIVLRPAGGGCSHRAFVLEGRGERCFVKLNEAAALPMFEAERDGLEALAAAGTFRVPRALGCGIIDGQAWLALEWLELGSIGGRQEAIAFGRALAALHRARGPLHGWRRDNFIGATPQANPRRESWPGFFAEARLRPQLALAAMRHPALAEKGELLAEKLPALFLDYRPLPSLLHGDLWHGNAAMCGGQPAVFDPAVFWGDRETDLAMTELFGGFPESFYAAYCEAWPLAQGHATRRTLYQLYHVLNHLNLFGSGYLRQAERMIGGLLAELRG